MEVLAPHWNRFSSIVEPHGETIITWMTEGSPVTNAPVKGWPMVSFSAAVAVVIAYLLFVVVGAALMKLKSSPVKVPTIITFLYNVLQVMLCSYMCFDALAIAWRNNYKLVCNEFVSEPAEGTTPPMANLLWLFYISKILDFFDTIKIILSQKWKQLSFLHVYHHSTIFVFYWLNANIGYDGDIYLTIVLNGAIHAMMYTYYFLTMHRSKTGEMVYVWWKSYLTLAQLAQFSCMVVQALTLLYKDGCSKFSPRLTTAYLAYISSLFVLFTHFFIQSYMGGGKKKGGKSKKN